MCDITDKHPEKEKEQKPMIQTEKLIFREYASPPCLLSEFTDDFDE